MLLDLLTEVPFEERNIPSRTTLLKEGSIADSVFYIQDGILRESHNHAAIGTVPSVDAVSTEGTVPNASPCELSSR